MTVEAITGVGAELQLSSRGKPFRPGTAYFGSVTGTRTTSLGCTSSRRAT